jgi:putative ABC transport system ATP-binding protein
VQLIEELNASSGSTVIIVTHDPSLAARTGRIIRLSDGRVVEDRQNGRSAAALGMTGHPA